MKKKNDLLFEQFKKFEISKQSAKANYGLVKSATVMTFCTQVPSGDDDFETTINDAC